MEMVNITIIIWVGFLPEETYFFQVKGRNLLLPGKREKPNFFCFLLEEMGETFFTSNKTYRDICSMYIISIIKAIIMIK